MRQLIDGRNHFFLEKIHHEKELLIHKGPHFLTLKYIVPSLYNPFHQNYDYLLFYGTMRRSKGDFNFDKERSPTVQLFDYYNLDFFNLDFFNEGYTPDRVVNDPESFNMDLNIEIELHSPLKVTLIQYLEYSNLRIPESAAVTMWGYRRIEFR
ncbi:hypothetical protein L798_14539 [Zootermopsis nevadensis]|uniref:Uncharacterized protein n=1 Tax=Zootermopsis nevadensis TaxID=136037 RepID=A0A067QPN0_ZOONE|nr:hypothetical protein L798_14539 [Zootermopsis nevadensis]